MGDERREGVGDWDWDWRQRDGWTDVGRMDDYVSIPSHVMMPFKIKTGFE